MLVQHATILHKFHICAVLLHYVITYSIYNKTTH